jgi:hypothetical protein
MNLLQQLRNNQVAIISLLVALLALGYNTWRNELTEHNRNIRSAGFEMLLHIAELQQITYLAHYDKDDIGGNPRKGWTEVLVLQDLAHLLPVNTQSATEALAVSWSQNWEALGTDDDAVASVEQQLDGLRRTILEALSKLD